ncbi:MAG: ATP-binding protein [Planctomycetota bacterium]
MTSLSVGNERPSTAIEAGAPVEGVDRVSHDLARALTATDLGELVGAFNDVTTRLQESHDVLRTEVSRLNGELTDANERLQRSRRLAELGEMAAGIAHELRNPLASIGLYARLLEEDLPDGSATAQTAGKIASAVRRMDAIVTDVLAFAREDRVRPEPVEVAAILRAAAETGREAASRLEHPPGIEVEPMGPGVPRDIACDPSLLHQALVNVVVNAVQAAAEADCAAADGVVCGARIRSELTADGARVAMLGVYVRDKGPGLPGDVMERMFNPFFTTRAAGTGLGLAIVHRIVDAHGGRVRAENNESGLGGATVELLLPIGSDGDVEGVKDDAGLVSTEGSK